MFLLFIRSLTILIFSEVLLLHHVPYASKFFYYRALEASMMSCQLPPTNPHPTSIDNEVPSLTDTTTPALPSMDEQLLSVMELSRKQQEDDEKRREEEEDELQQILQLSMTEK